MRPWTTGCVWSVEIKANVHDLISDLPHQWLWSRHGLSSIIPPIKNTSLFKPLCTLTGSTEDGEVSSPKQLVKNYVKVNEGHASIITTSFTLQCLRGAGVTRPHLPAVTMSEVWLSQVWTWLRTVNRLLTQLICLVLTEPSREFLWEFAVGFSRFDKSCRLWSVVNYCRFVVDPQSGHHV